MRTCSSPRDSRSATSSGAVSQSLKVSAAAGVCAASCATSSEYAVTYPSAGAQPTGPPPAMATSTSGSSSTADQRFDIPNRFRRRRRQHLAPGGRHHYVILDAHARIPELPGDVIGGTDVAARFHRQRHAGLEAPPFAPRLVLPGVVDIEPEPVPGAVHVEAFVILGLDHFFDRAATQA